MPETPSVADPTVTTVPATASTERMTAFDHAIVGVYGLLSGATTGVIVGAVIAGSICSVKRSRSARKR